MYYIIINYILEGKENKKKSMKARGGVKQRILPIRYFLYARLEQKPSNAWIILATMKKKSQVCQFCFFFFR